MGEAAAGTGVKTTVLGENMGQRVMPFAEAAGDRTIPFGTDSGTWSKMSPAERWKMNDGALRARINEGDNFKYIGQDPGRPLSVRREFDLTGSELLRLNDRGISAETITHSEVQKAIGLP